MELINIIHECRKQWMVWEKTPTLILISFRLEREFAEYIINSGHSQSICSFYNHKNMIEPSIFGVPVIFCDLGENDFKMVSDNPAPRDKEWRGVNNVVWAEDLPPHKIGS